MGTTKAEDISNPLAGAIVRLEMVSKGQGDPVEAAEEEAKGRREIEAQDDWDDATDVALGDGYQGERGRFDYGRLS